MSSPSAVTLTVNGRRRTAKMVPDPERLLDTLRWRLDLKGTKEGCRSGGCGACTVLVNGQPTLACLTLTQEVAGSRVQTIEGAAADPVGRRVQAAFAEETALQCGYCTPGFVMATWGLLRSAERTPTPEMLLEDLQGNLCRCTGYASIQRAVLRLLRGQK